MSDKIVPINKSISLVEKSSEMTPDEALERWKGQLSDVLIIGINKDRNKTTLSGTTTYAQAFYLLEVAKKLMFEGTDGAV